MYSVGQMVLYGPHGVCTVAEIETRQIDRQKVEYYALEPVGHREDRFLVPTGNQAALSKLKPLLSPQQLEALLSAAQLDGEWIADENRRKQRYRELIVSGDRGAILSMVHAIHHHREQQLAIGRKLHLCDENFLRDAQKLLAQEFSIVLGIPQEQVGEYIQSRL